MQGADALSTKLQNKEQVLVAEITRLKAELDAGAATTAERDKLAQEAADLQRQVEKLSQDAGHANDLQSRVDELVAEATARTAQSEQ